MNAPRPPRHSVPDEDLVRLRDMIDRAGVLAVLDAIRFDLETAVARLRFHAAGLTSKAAGDPAAVFANAERLERLAFAISEALGIFGVRRT